MSKPIIVCIFFILIACESNTTGAVDSLDQSMIADASSGLSRDAMMPIEQNNLDQEYMDLGIADQTIIDQEMDAYDRDPIDQDMEVSDQFTEYLDQNMDMDRDMQQLPDMLIRYEDDPLFTVDAPESLTLPANQTQSYQFSVHFIQLIQSIQAWSFSLIAHPIDQCRFTEIDVMDTLAASVNDEPPGLVNQGFTDMRVVSTSEGSVALSVVIFSLEQRTVLTPERIDQPLTYVTLEVNAPAEGERTTCTIQVASNIPIQNQLIDQVVVWEGQSLPLFFRPVQIEILGE